MMQCRLLALCCFYVSFGSAAVLKQVQLTASNDQHKRSPDTSVGFLAQETSVKRNETQTHLQQVEVKSWKSTRMWEVACDTHIKKRPDEIICPEACQYIRAEPTRLCQFKCVPALECNSDNPLASFANPKTLRCEACQVPGCHRCGTESNDVCSICQDGFRLHKGKCVSLYRKYWNMSFAILGLLAACVVYYLVAVWMRPVVNESALKAGTEFRKLSATRYVDGRENAWYKLTTNLRTNSVTGIGTILHFRWQRVIMVWAIFGTILFGIAGILFWERLGIWHRPNSSKSYEACEENIKHVEHEFSQMEVFYFGCTAILYVVTFVGSLYLAYYQRWYALEEDRDETTMKDFAIFCEGFKEMDGSLEVEKIICNQLRSQKQFEGLDIVTVSVAWKYRKEISRIEDLLDRELDALDAKRAQETEVSLPQHFQGGSDDTPHDAANDTKKRSCADPYCFSVDPALGIGEFECLAEPEDIGADPEEVTLNFLGMKEKGSSKLEADPNTGRVNAVGGQSEAAGVQKGWRATKLNGRDFTQEALEKCESGGDAYKITFKSNKELVQTFHPDLPAARQKTRLGIKSYDDTGIVDEVERDSQAQKAGVEIGWKMVSLNGKPYTPELHQALREAPDHKPYDITFSKEVLKLLKGLRSSTCCFVVLKSEEQKNIALERLREEPLQIKDSEDSVRPPRKIITREAYCEPSTVIWKGFGSTRFNFYSKAVLGCFVVFVAVILLDIFFYAPYVAYIYSYSDVPGMSQGSFLSNFTLSLLICVCNAAIYAIIGIITDRCAWTNGDSKDCFYCVKYTIAVFFNTCLDLGTVLILAQGFSIDEAIKQQVADDSTMSTKAMAESPNMQRAIYEQLVAYIFPSCTLVPFLIEPFATTFGPFLVGSWLVRSRKDVTASEAERALQCPPFDLSRYGDIIVNMMLCCLTLVFTYPCLWYLFAYMIISLAVIYIWDHLRVLRYTTRTYFANNIMDNSVMYMMAMPCGVLLTAMVFKAYGASHQGLLEELKNQFRGEYGVSADRYNIIKWMSLAFAGHLFVHWALLKFVVIPLAETHKNDEDPRQPVREKLLEKYGSCEKVYEEMGFTEDKLSITAEEFMDFLDHPEKGVKWQDTPTCGEPPDLEKVFSTFKPRTNTRELKKSDVFPPDYDASAADTPANWLTTNPVFCLRSKYIFKDKIPCTFFRIGKEHLIKKNEAIKQYYEREAVSLGQADDESLLTVLRHACLDRDDDEDAAAPETPAARAYEKGKRALDDIGKAMNKGR